MIILETERLILREFKIDDINDFEKIYLEKKVTEFIEKNMCSFEEISGIKSYNKKLGFWTLVEKDSKRVIGKSGLLLKNIEGKEEVELVYLLDFDKWGNGYATEIAKAIIKYAFEKVKIYRIIALIDEKNKKSIGVAKRVNMKYERKVKCDNGFVNLYYINKEKYCR